MISFLGSLRRPTYERRTLLDFAAIPWVQGSLVVVALSVVVSVFAMVYKGLLIPRPTHDAVVTVLEQRITEKNTEAVDYRAAWLAEQTARREQDGQLGELLEYARTTDQVIRALARREGRGRDAMAP